ncbi:MAG: AraC family transcriptional regulator [Blastocatellia bacterium]|nr:AraC family transcriptional regulator [Blastocatellia bacterium]
MSGTKGAKPLSINPPGSSLGSENAVLMGTARQYHIPEFEGCLSIKTVVDGAGLWKTAGREFVVRENSYLVVNDGQPYTLTIDSAQNVTTFCIFFERGFVEDVFRNATLKVPQLLESPLAERQIQLQFPDCLETQESPVLGMVRNLRRRILQGEVSQTALDTGLYSIAAEMVNQQLRDSAGHEKVSSIRHSTREELYRRVLRGRDFLLSSLDQPVRLKDIARAACLSSFHFHRVFKETFGVTPQKYLAIQRLERAAHLLRHTGRTVTEITLESGFQSPGSFSSLFSRHFGVSPTEYRRSVRKN